MIKLTEKEIHDSLNAVMVIPAEHALELAPELMKKKGYSEASIKRNMQMLRDLREGKDDSR